MKQIIKIIEQAAVGTLMFTGTVILVAVGVLFIFKN